MPGVRTQLDLKDVDKGYRKLATLLGEMGSITLGVQGEEALKPHPSAEDLTVGEIAAIHELGLGVPQRSWLGLWLEEHEDQMMRETRDALQRVLRGELSRNKALQELGLKWAQALRDNIWEGNIRPPLTAERIQRKKGETRPLLDTYSLMNAITYKVFLPAFKSIRDAAQRAAARGKR